jgi:hypothetical protein
MEMPDTVRTSVAGLAMSAVKYAKAEDAKVARVIRLDPDNAAAWTWRCSTQPNDDAKVALAACQKAIQLTSMERNAEGLGRAQERLGDFCAAEESFTMANHNANAGDADVLRSMGRMALTCGHTAGAVAIFEVAVDTDTKQNEDEDVTLDYEWLVVANNADHKPAGAAEACSKAQKDWKSCDCSAVGEKVICREAK